MRCSANQPCAVTSCTIIAHTTLPRCTLHYLRLRVTALCKDIGGFVDLPRLLEKYVFYEARMISGDATTANSAYIGPQLSERPRRSSQPVTLENLTEHPVYARNSDYEPRRNMMMLHSALHAPYLPLHSPIRRRAREHRNTTRCDQGSTKNHVMLMWFVRLCCAPANDGHEGLSVRTKYNCEDVGLRRRGRLFQTKGALEALPRYCSDRSST